MKTKPIFSITLLTIAPIMVLANESTTLAPIIIEEERVAEPGISSQSPEEVLGTPADAGDLLRDIPGVSGSRMGGHGIDPVIRGQSQTQLNILLDGAYVHGGCPNRMDPPTAYSPIESYDNITVIKGSQTVRYGSGGSGGTVLFERKTPRLTEQQPIRGKIGSGYSSHSDGQKLFADVTAGTTQGFARGIVESEKADNYEDGDGNTTRSAFSSQSGNLIFGYTPSDKTRFEIGLEATRIDDVWYSGAGMDAPKSDNNTIRLKYQNASGTQAQLYQSEVEHVMDNYSLRPLTAPMKMQVSAESKTQGGRLSHQWLTDTDMEWTIGIDYQHNYREANRFAGPANVANPSNLQSMMWPMVDLTQFGLFTEMNRPIGEQDLLKMGWRYDRITSETNQTAVGNINPNDLYQKYYGKAADAHDENNLAGFVRYEHGLDDGLVFVSLSRSVRTADATERFLAANNNNAAQRWIGNPDLAPEQHHQLELGLSKQQPRWDMNTSLFYNWVNDYILRDRAHAQDGIWQHDNATIYRNVEAQLYGFEWETNVNFHNHWATGITLAYVHATNTTDDRPIAQTPPLQGTLRLDYRQPNWRLGGQWQYAAKQTRVDDDPNIGSGLDAGQTPRFTVLDFYGKINLNKKMAIKLGINNVLDNTYAYHLNRANVDPFNPVSVQVNEPGRAFWLNWSMDF
jgi:iron complex outermembrane receptor protein